MKSIFEIHDGDAVEPGYSIPGYEITVRPSRATQNRLEVFRPGGVLDAELTVGLRRFDGMPWNRDTMIKVGIWLQRKEAAAGRGRISLTASFRPEHPAEHVTLSPDAFRGDRFDSANAGGALPGLREAADAAVRRRAEEREREARRDALAFFNEAFSEAGVVIESLSVEALEGTVRLVGHAGGIPFEVSVPHRVVGSAWRPGCAYTLLDAIWCPLCGSRDHLPGSRVITDEEQMRSRKVCIECYAHMLGAAPRKLRELDALQDVLRALHALPTPAADMAAAYLAEQCAAGGVDCDETRRRALERVRAELHVAEHVEWAVRAIHRVWLPNLARVQNDRHDRVEKPEPPPLDDFVRWIIRNLAPGAGDRLDLRIGSLDRALVDAGRAYERACRGA